MALRADFDALPIQDEKDVPYASQIPGVMHACGHDGHTAALLAVGKVLYRNREKLKGSFVMIHQHAEELSPGGAKSMIEDGCLEHVDAIFGTHLWATEPVGTVLCRPGAVMAAADGFTIKVIGKGGHGAIPHDTKDAVLIGSQIVTALQHIVSRRVNPVQPAVISAGSFIAENPFNAIADQAVISGTVRSFDESVRSLLEAEIEAVVKESVPCTPLPMNIVSSAVIPPSLIILRKRRTLRQPQRKQTASRRSLKESRRWPERIFPIICSIQKAHFSLRAPL